MATGAWDTADGDAQLVVTGAWDMVKENNGNLILYTLTIREMITATASTIQAIPFNPGVNCKEA